MRSAIRATMCKNDQSAGKAPSLWQNRVVIPLLDQLRQGTSPGKLAESMAWGAVIGIFPILGTTTILSGVVAIWLRLNHIAIQISNWLVYPLQFALIIPFIKLGSIIFGGPRMHLSLDEITSMFQLDFMKALHELGGHAARAVGAWCLMAIPAVVIFRLMVSPAMSRLAKRTTNLDRK